MKISSAGNSYTLASSTSPLVLTVQNTLPYNVPVRVQITGGERVGLTVTDPEIQVVPAGRSLQVKIPAEVTRSGQFQVAAQLLGADGTAWGHAGGALRRVHRLRRAHRDHHRRGRWCAGADGGAADRAASLAGAGRGTRESGRPSPRADGGRIADGAPVDGSARTWRRHSPPTRPSAHVPAPATARVIPGPAQAPGHASRLGRTVVTRPGASTQQPDRCHRDRRSAARVDDVAGMKTARTGGVVRAGAVMARRDPGQPGHRLPVQGRVLVSVLGFGIVNDAYTLANTLPNIVFELLIGGVLTSVAIPLLSRARSRPGRRRRCTPSG